MIKRTEDFSIKDLVSLFIPRLWLVIIVALLLGSVFGVYSSFLTEETYTSKAKIHIVKQNSSMSSADIDVVSKVIDDYKILIGTDLFLTYVLDEIQLSPDYVEAWGMDNRYIAAHMGAVGLTDDILQITITTDDKDKSYVVANAVSNVIISLIITFDFICISLTILLFSLSL